MKRASVDSTSIASIGYDPRRRELEVEFRESGDVYRYFGVSAGEYADLMAAKSKGNLPQPAIQASAAPFFCCQRGQTALVARVNALFERRPHPRDAAIAERELMSQSISEWMFRPMCVML